MSPATAQRPQAGVAGLVRELTPPLRLLVASQLAFNVGFYLVVPFLAAHLSGDLALAGWIVGLVLGLRTFSQQGMFFLGGALADRFGVRRSIVLGCLVRIAGFVVLGLSAALPGVVVGVVLVGLAAALFSPATESAIVAWGDELERAGGPSLAEVVGLEAMASKLGSVLGPLLGAALLGVPFSGTCLAAAGIFGVILLAQLRWLPRDARTGAPAPVLDSLGQVLRNRRFLVFAAIHSSYLLAYNQLYLAAPVELVRIGAPAGVITWLFALAAVVVIGGQLPVTRLVAGWSLLRRLVVGYAAIAAGFLVVAVAAPATPPSGVAACAPLVGFVVLLHGGQILLLPAARAVTAELAGGRLLGTHLGLLSTAGGIAVLIGSSLAGGLLDAARTPGWAAAVPWLLLAAAPAASAVAIRRLGPTR